MALEALLMLCKMPARRHAFILTAAWVCAVSAAPENFHQVDSRIWRSAQPKASDFADLKKLGITEMLNLREWHDDAAEAKGTPMHLHHVAMNAGSVRETQLVRAVSILRDSRNPILVHCWHGSDRTGIVVALYRMMVQGWPREKAIAEFTEPRFGYHAGTYPQLRTYLEKVDIAEFRKAMN
jgi:protein-tyrosine phosphatase